MDDTTRIMAIAGVLAVGVAALAWFQDRRRLRRRDLDRVGFMPWTSLFFWSLMIAVLLLGLSGRAWIAG